VIERVITGGQTGADQAGWRAAKAAGIATGGWMPKGFLTETPDGKGVESHPEFADLYGAVEHSSPSYPPRTEANVCMARAVAWFGDVRTPGAKLTLGLARVQRYPTFTHSLTTDDPGHLIDWFLRWDIRILMVAGNRESSAPGIGAWVETYLADVFRLLLSA
jgi:hypothetical protein